MTITYSVLGYCDVYAKRWGMDDLVMFREEDRFEAIDLPTNEALIDYATARGYYPSGKPDAVQGVCRPVYKGGPMNRPLEMENIQVVINAGDDVGKMI